MEMKNSGIKLKLTDKIGLKFINASLHSLRKEKLLGVLAIVYDEKNKDSKYKEEVEKEVIKVWKIREYDIKELCDYIAFLKIGE
jgi:hypothetical protein